MLISGRSNLLGFNGLDGFDGFLLVNFKYVSVVISVNQCGPLKLVMLPLPMDTSLQLLIEWDL